DPIVGAVAAQIKIEPPPVVGDIANANHAIPGHRPPMLRVAPLAQQPATIAHHWFNRAVIQKAPLDNIEVLANLGGAKEGHGVALALLGVIFVKIATPGALLTEQGAIILREQHAIRTVSTTQRQQLSSA